MRVRATASGRVNLIGDHTDYMGGPVMPMAIDLATTVDAEPGGARLHLISDAEPDPLSIPLPVADPGATEPPWGRFGAAVAAELGSTAGLDGAVTTTIPVGAGLSSSTALQVAIALALIAATDPQRTELLDASAHPRLADTRAVTGLALLCQRAERRAVGVPGGIMDQLAICAGREGTAMVIDCESLSITHVPVPEGAVLWALHSGRSRRLAESAYAERRASAEAAQELVGSLPRADERAIERLTDPVLRRRARHVRAECERVLRFADALGHEDLRRAGELMCASHASLRDDYEVSTAELDALSAALTATPGVYGARLTGAGFGGCVVALADAEVDLGAMDLAPGGTWKLTPSRGIRVELG